MKLKPFLESQPPRFWVWGGAVALLALLVLGFGLSLLFSKASYTEAALENGQLITIDLASGAVEGKVIAVAPVTTLPPELPAQEAAEAAAPTEDEVAGEPVPEPATTDTTPAEPTVSETATEDPETAEEITPENPTIMPAARIPPRENPEVTETEISPPPVEAAIQAAEVLPSDVLPQIDPQLSEHTEAGLVLPKVAGGTKPSKFYARPFTPKEKTPVVAIALTGLGFSKSITETAILLPGAISLVFTPYAKDSPIWIGNARSRGHEVWLEVPMEPSDFPASDPGPHALIAAISIKENIDRLQWVMSRFPGFTGLYSPKDEVVTLNDALVKAILDELKLRGLTLMVGNVTGNPARNEFLRGQKDTAILPDIVLGDDTSASALKVQLEEAEAVAKKRGYVLLVGRAYPSVMRVIDTWYRTLPSKGIALAPASAIPGLKK